MRGEQAPHGDGADIKQGSPPLARGTGFCLHLQAHLFAITPACAGNRYFIIFNSLRAWDHPRLRGEQHAAANAALRALGSPPLARGTERQRHPVVIHGFITPACAGNRITIRQTLTGNRDHPRLRGEQALPPAKRILYAGSPPLARGTGLALA